MDQRPYVLGWVMEHGRVPHTADDSPANEVLGERLLPVQRGIPRAVEAEPQLADEVGVHLRILDGQLHVEVPGALGVR
jgi:hypothetical protein